MSHSSFAVRLVGNLAALAGFILLVGWGVDYAAGWLGYRSHASCTLLHPVVTVAYEIEVLMTCIGVIMWVASFGKSQSGLTLAIGGFLLFALPLVLPRYLGVVCLL
ncbi:hypothetical protein HGP16_20230 [Rhizobium sp. P40RR-XXII]|uniref:hypothetical protein n=1 Tax=unclassified Rhizobium TaxID=2613769 RepID=UPI0014576412|nr:MULTISPECIES: hypothetical protein [unclassified Rhizobium]NLR85973.1 hypothetical protein [Rhizobium sp. P28RR-XV]NLS18873.1 hypothetical protein [Rhizobium sp. P40RR-XXII]